MVNICGGSVVLRGHTGPPLLCRAKRPGERLHAACFGKWKQALGKEQVVQKQALSRPSSSLALLAGKPRLRSSEVEERYLPPFHLSCESSLCPLEQPHPHIRTGIIRGPPQELARSVTSPLTWQSYGGIKRQRKTITDPLTLIPQTSGRWEKSTYTVWKGAADWASAGFCIFGAGQRLSEALSDGEALRLTSSPLNRSRDMGRFERTSGRGLSNIRGRLVELLHPGSGGNGCSE